LPGSPLDGCAANALEWVVLCLHLGHYPWKSGGFKRENGFLEEMLI